jgi:hypothetical protein
LLQTRQGVKAVRLRGSDVSGASGAKLSYNRASTAREEAPMRLTIALSLLAVLSSAAGCGSDSACPAALPTGGGECRGSATCYYQVCPTPGSWPHEARCRDGQWQIISSGCPAPPPDGGGEAGAPDAGRREAQISEAGSCTQGTLTPIGRLCVRGEPAKGGEQILDGASMRIQLYPKGCFSSSCTIKYQTVCSTATSGSTIQVTGLFCLEQKSGSCSTDCSGGGYAECSPGPLAAGSYTASGDGMTVPFTIPGMLPVGGVCQSQ